MAGKVGNLATRLPQLGNHSQPVGMVWLCWPDKASKISSVVSQDTIRNAALAEILVDVKVCAADLIRSGLKMVIRNDLRAGLS